MGAIREKLQKLNLDRLPRCARGQQAAFYDRTHEFPSGFSRCRPPYLPGSKPNKRGSRSKKGALREIDAT